MSDMDKVLNCPMGDNDAGAKTIKGYLKALLVKIWEEGESFGGKRPFGNSGWEHEIYTALVKGSLIEGTIDEYGNLDDYQGKEANALIFSAIGAM